MVDAPNGEKVCFELMMYKIKIIVSYFFLFRLLFFCWILKELLTAKALLEIVQLYLHSALWQAVFKFTTFLRISRRMTCNIYKWLDYCTKIFFFFFKYSFKWFSYCLIAFYWIWATCARRFWGCSVSKVGISCSRLELPIRSLLWARRRIVNSRTSIADLWQAASWTSSSSQTYSCLFYRYFLFFDASSWAQSSYQS